LARPATLLDDVLTPSDLAPTRLRDAVLRKLTDAIMSGRLEPGDALPPESRIAASFGVSKQVAREAVHQLAAMGVVHIQQGKATRVCLLNAEPLGRFFRFAVRGSQKGMAEAVEMRRVLEPAIAALAAQRRSEADVARLRTILQRLEQAMANIPAWIEADLDFHESITSMAGNRLLQLQMRGLRPVIRQIMESFTAGGSRSHEAWMQTLHRHERILEGVASGDAARARAAMELHFEAADQAITSLFPPAAPAV